MNFEQVITALQAGKGSGLWSEVSRTSGISYDTVARIARGFIANPGVPTVEAIAKALPLEAAQDSAR